MLKRGLNVCLACVPLALVLGCPNPLGTPCSSDAACNDGVECTLDACVAGVCVNDSGPCTGGQTIDLRSMPDAAIAELDVQSEVTSITISSPPVVHFRVTTANGTPIAGIGSLWVADDRFVRFTLAKLLSGSNGDSSAWVSYTRETTGDGSTPPNYDTGSSLVDHGDGTYTFTFKTDVTAVTGVTYEPTLSHRVAGQIGSNTVSLEAQNLYQDFVPAGGDLTLTRNITTTTTCNECHGRLVIHGRRYLTEYCVNCHNPDLANGEGDMKYMIHKIHSAQKFDTLDDGVDYSEVTYPQDIRNCRKCHTAENEATPDGDNWKNVPNMVACGACHTGVNFETGENHAGGAQANNSLCVVCHSAASIEEYHLTNTATPNNPDVPSDLSNFSYDIAEARVNAGNELQIDLSVLRDGTALDLLNLPEDLTSGPAFLFAYAAGPQDGVDNPIDFNNLGRSAGQPQSVNLRDLITGGSVAASGTDGVYTITVPDAFPVGAGMRVVSLQSRFSQIVGEETIDRPTPSVVKAVTDDVQRRTIVDPVKCGNCHEWLTLHGGSRIVTATTDPTQPFVCALCHNANLSSSGRAIDPATQTISEEVIAAAGDDPSVYPERAQDFRHLVHGIHASGRRTEPYEFVRNRTASGITGFYFDWAEVTYPGVLNNCLTCHVEGTYELPLQDGILLSTERTTTGAATEDAATVTAARGSVPNGTDLVNTPTAGTCFMCHDSAAAVSHMELNGGQINVLLREELVVGAGFVGVGADDLTRDEVLDRGVTESCVVCHGPGRDADLNVVHGIK